MEPLISVIVPIYKIEKYIGICIESILNQTYKNLEIILVDDGSPDRCPEICDLYASKDKRIKVIHKSNGGLVSARKSGVLAASGDYIGYVDGDDWIGRGFFQSLYSVIAESGSDIAIAGYSRDLFSKSQNMLNNFQSGIYSGDSLEKLFCSMISYKDFFQHGITTYVWNKLFRRDLIMQRQLNVDEDITIGEDAAVVYPLLLDCKRICITDNCAYHYRQREDSMLKKSGDFHNEAKRLKILYDFMNDAVKDYSESYNLKNQINDFLTATYIIRSGGDFGSSEDTSLFSEKIIGKKIIIYGAGTFGQQLIKRINEKSLCSVVGWVDADYWEYRRCCMNVDPIECVLEFDYDYILIANLNSFCISESRRELMDFGVGSNKILSLQTTKEFRKSALAGYLKLSK